MDAELENANEVSTDELMTRGRLALEALEYREQAARYRAAASSLRAAMVQAESGHRGALQEWLNHQQVDVPVGIAADGSIPTSDTPTHTEHSKSKTEQSIWSSMETGAKSRNLHGTLSNADHGHLRTSDEPSPWSNSDDSSISEIDIDEDSGGDLSEYSMDSEELESHSELSETGPVIALAELPIADAEIDLPARPWWKAPHVLVSMVIHGLLIFVGSFFAFAAVQKPEILAIAAGIVESDQVLTETPMEVPSELDDASEPMAASSSLDAISIPTDIPSVSTPVVHGVGPGPAAPAAGSSAGSVISQSMGNGKGNGGSKLMTGAEFFGTKATGNTFIYVVDASPSMLRDGAFDSAKQEIMKSLASMKPKQRYFISFFGKEIDPLAFVGGKPEKYPLYATPENLRKTLDWINRVVIQKDGRPPIDALKEAISMQPDGIFLLFDGDTKVDRWTSMVRDANRTEDLFGNSSIKVPIHVVHFFRDEFQKPMKLLAEENGGTYRFVPRPEKPNRGKK